MGPAFCTTPLRGALGTSLLGAVIGGLGMAAVLPLLVAPGVLVGLLGGVAIGVIPAFFPAGPMARTVVASFAAMLLSWAGTLHASALLVQIDGALLLNGAGMAWAGAAIVLLGPLSSLIVCRQPQDRLGFRICGALASLPFILGAAWFGNGLCVGLDPSHLLASVTL